MKDYVFVGWPVGEAQSAALRRGILVEAVRETTALKNNAGKGIPYVIQERWIDAHTVIIISGLRLTGDQEQIDGC